MYGHIVLAGNLGSDPEKRKTEGGSKFVTFRLACQLEGHDKEPTWFDVAVFHERPAKFVAEYVKKGSSVVLAGRLRPNTFARKDGTQVEDFSIVADDVSFISSGKKKDDDGGSGGESKPAAQEPAADPSDDW
jgi:single-strand DNA-binding protein